VVDLVRDVKEGAMITSSSRGARRDLYSPSPYKSFTKSFVDKSRSVFDPDNYVNIRTKFDFEEFRIVKLKLFLAKYVEDGLCKLFPDVASPILLCRKNRIPCCTFK